MDLMGPRQNLSVEMPDQARSKVSFGSDKRVKSSMFDKPLRLSTKTKQLIEDYAKVHKENQDLVRENARLQTGIAHYFKEHLQDGSKDGKKNKHETKEQSDRLAEEAEAEQQRRFENGFKTMKELNRKIAAAAEEGRAKKEAIKNSAVQKDIKVRQEWKNFQDLQNEKAKQATYRNGNPIEIADFTELQSRIDQKLDEWRQVGLKGATIWIRKTHLEEQLRKLDNFGGNLSLNYYDELKAMSRLHQERNDNSLKELEAAHIKHAHGSQVVAHLSEKVAYLKVLKKELDEKMEMVDQQVAEERERLNNVKIKRDAARKEAGELKERTGIMYSPHLLYDLEHKIKHRNNLIRKLHREKRLFTDMLAKARHQLPVDTETHFQNMARGNLPFLPEIVQSEEDMDAICSYSGKQHTAGDRAEENATKVKDMAAKVPEKRSAVIFT